MKNVIQVLPFVFLSLFACKEEPKISTLDRAKVELEVQKQTLHEKQELKKIEDELNSINESIQKLNGLDAKKATSGRIVGKDVIMRVNASIQSEKVDYFRNNENVSILQKQIFISNREGLLNRDLALENNDSLKRGKAVLISAYFPASDTYSIEYARPGQGNQILTVPSYVVDKTENESWYQVQRDNGKSGWVYGKFLTEL